MYSFYDTNTSNIADIVLKIDLLLTIWFPRQKFLRNVGETVMSVSQMKWLSSYKD